MKDEITVYVPNRNLPQPDEPLKPSTSLEVLTNYIGEERAREVKAGKALVENPWTGRIYEDDSIFYISVESRDESKK